MNNNGWGNKSNGTSSLFSMSWFFVLEKTNEQGKPFNEGCFLLHACFVCCVYVLTIFNHNGPFMLNCVMNQWHLSQC